MLEYKGAGLWERPEGVDGDGLPDVCECGADLIYATRGAVCVDCDSVSCSCEVSK